MKIKYIKTTAILNLSFALLLFSFSSCNQEEIRPREFPRLETLAVTEVDSTGATFNAKIISLGNQSIEEYGFVWGSSGSTNIDLGEWKTIAGSPSSSLFSARIPATLAKNKSYYVKAYTKTQDYKNYGLAVNFVSQGSNGPEIESFSPSHADIGDTITVVGKNFSVLENTTSASIGGVKSDPILMNHDSIQFIVPDTITSESSEISISVSGNISKAKTLFTINPPEIFSVSPTEVINNTLITIKGKNFGFGPAHVLFGETEGNVVQVSKDEIRVRFPTNLSTGFTPLSLNLYGRTVFAEEEIENKSVYIKDYLPKTGTWNDEIEIKLQNYNPINQTKVYFNAIPAIILGSTDSSLRVKVPLELLHETSSIKVVSGLSEFTSKVHFHLNKPEITDFFPKEVAYGGTLKVMGKNFHPTASYNAIAVSGTLKNFEIRSATSTELTVLISRFVTTPFLLEVTIGDMVGVSEEEFSIIPAEIESISPKNISYNDTVSIRGKGFSAYYTNYVYLSDYTCNVRYNSDSLVKFIVPSYGLEDPDGQLEMKIGTQNLTSDNLSFIWHKTLEIDDAARDCPAGFQIEDNYYYYYGLGIGTLGQAYGSYSDQDFFRYNINTNRVNKINNFPGNSFNYGVAFAHNGKGYIGLGIEEYSDAGSKNIWEYNPENDSWVVVDKFPYGNLAYPVNFVVDQYLYVGLGELDGVPTQKFWRWDIEQKLWEEVAEFPGEKRYGAASFAINNKAYVGFGGQYPQSWDHFNDFWSFDPATNTWKKIASPVSDGYSFSSTFTLNGYGYVVGGIMSSGNQRSLVYKYNPDTDIWSQQASFGGGERGFGAGFSYQGYGYFLYGGGRSDVWKYDPSLERN